ncbi:MAG: Na+/H+ antiporter subunit E [Clostridia bacterium]|jgi:multicomponent Na+:H+ antiporter subunit E|nr:Na+/H+ antiporter subunit E [Clostridia bacterium]MBT7122206.1 Na+/H+ antiporter subunit E [Clostridia bacterium]
MKKTISTFLVLLAIWVLLTGFNWMEVVLGAAVSLVLAIIISRFVNYSFGFGIILGLIKFIVIYIPVFIFKLVLANIDIAYRVLSPKLPINPGIVKVPTKLKSDFGKFVLANSITLTPGTLSLDVEDDEVIVHWVNVKGKTSGEHQSRISKTFEKLLGGIVK